MARGTWAPIPKYRDNARNWEMAGIFFNNRITIIVTFLRTIFFISL